MATVFRCFDDSPTAFINPTDVVPLIEDFPKVCISTYSEKIIEAMSKLPGTEIITVLKSANGDLPVYRTEYQGKQIGFFLSRVGAPACVAGMEEIIASGATGLVFFGCCGVLNEEAVEDKIIVPVSAVRDEGTGYHYVSAGEEICAQESCIGILKECLDTLGYAYIMGKTWTTDAIYRETRWMVEERRKQGCLTVEMEVSAVYAAAQFRKIPVIQFLYGADNLDCEKWEQRDLTDYGMGNCNKYVRLALECALRL